VAAIFTFHFNLPSKAMSTEGGDRLPITRGEIYIETDDGYFPCPGWGDRLLSVISHWIGNIIIMLDPKYGEQTVTNYFMNGPYFFDLQKIGKDRINIRFMRRIGESEAREEIPSLTIAFAEYCDALLSLTESIIRDPSFQWLEKAQTRINFERSVAKLRASL
jgi:hypothetical protein